MDQHQGKLRAALGSACHRSALLAAVAVLVAAGCGSMGGGSKAKPDWVDGPATHYPAGDFLLGRGSAESVDLAQERARADLAKIFEVTVQAESSDLQRSKREGDQIIYDASSEQRVVTRTEKVISGIRIAELWNAPAVETGGAGRQHALAVLSRQQAGNALRQEIITRDEAIGREVTRARSAEDALSRAGYASRALALARERAGFEQSLRVVDLGGRGVETQFSVARLQTDLAEQLKRVGLTPTLTASGPFDETALLPLLKGAITESGFVAGEGNGVTVYSVRVTARMDDQFTQGWHWVRGNLELVLTDASGRVRGSKAWPLKASAQEQKAARARMLLEIEKLLKQELRPAVLGFAAS